MAGMMALSAGVGATGAVYLRPVQPTQQPPVAIAPPAPIAPPVEVVRTVRTVSWFKSHQAEMRSKVALCNDNPGVGHHDPECLNALEAKQHVEFSNFINSK
jgi:hypothetical protein